MPSPPTSPTPRETGGVDGAETDEEQDFFSFQGVTEGQKEPGGSKLRGWNKSDNAKMEMDRETPSWLRVNTHPRSVGVRVESCCRAHYEMTLTQPDLLRRFIWHFRPITPPHHHHHHPAPEILSPPVWQLFKLHVHLTQKDPANVPLPRFNRSCFLGSLAALIYLEDRLLIQRDWDARWEESAAVWVLNSSQTPIDSWGWSTFIEQTARKKEKRKKRWQDDRERSCQGAWLAHGWLYIDNYNYADNQFQGNYLVSFLHYLIFYKKHDWKWLFVVKH